MLHSALTARACGLKPVIRNMEKYFAHSIFGQDKSKWQPLAEHLRAVSQLTASRAAKFSAGTLGGVIGLLHDLGK
jgi:CRISPR-associated endonuclease/helicase Cas3